MFVDRSRTAAELARVTGPGVRVRLMPRLAKAVPDLGYIVVAASRPA